MASAASDDYRTVEQLLDAASDAPTFGVNARELILLAARQIAQETQGETGDGKESAEATKELLKSLFKEGPRLLRALSREERPLVPFRAIHSSKVPRVTRQSVLERLAGQHLALALHTAGEPIDEAALTGPWDGRKAALEAAVAQEEALYARGRLSKSVYLNYAAKTNAGLWPAREGHIQDSGPLSAATVEAGSHSPNDGVTSEAENRKAATHSEMSRKRQKLNRPAALVEVDIDWEQPTALPSDATLQSSGTACSKQPEIAADGTSSPEASIRIVPVPEHAAVSAEGLEDYSPSRHGGESPPRGPPTEARPTVAEAPRQTMTRDPQAPPWNPAVASALLKFLKSQADPLYDARALVITDVSIPTMQTQSMTCEDQAQPGTSASRSDQVISRLVYKRAMQKTVEKVMRSHLKDCKADFLVREGGKISALLRQYIDREMGREKCNSG